MDYAAILSEAFEAANTASTEQFRRHGDHAACGFAWVTIDGNDGLARWCRKQIKAVGSDGAATREAERAYGRKGYPSGWLFWNPWRRQEQSLFIHEAGARAFRDTLGEYGTRADMGSRLD